MSLIFWRRLFHHWFVEYNPLYLLSACCALIGVNELSAGLSHSVYSWLAVAAVAELYAWALVASAAFLMRAEQRRPAVMLTLLIAIYQCDPTLHTETCAYMGNAGALAGAAWLTSFIAKFSVLASAMRVRLSRSALGVAAFGALGVLVFPLLLRQLSPVTMSSLVALWIFALFVWSLWGSPRITSVVALDAWAQRVLKRSVRAIWGICAALTIAHVWFWSSEFELRYGLAVPITLLLSTRWMPRESSAWLAVAAALLCGFMMPPLLATVACMAAFTLALRALRKPSELAADEQEALGAGLDPHARAARFNLAPRFERLRLLIGSASLGYLSLWTLGWSGGALPGHAFWLDSSLSVVLLAMVWSFRAYVALVPLALSYLHLGVQSGTLSLPRTRAQWGLSEVGLGFALLATAVLTSWQSKRDRPAASSPPAEPYDELDPP